MNEIRDFTYRNRSSIKIESYFVDNKQADSLTHSNHFYGVGLSIYHII